MRMGRVACSLEVSRAPKVKKVWDSGKGSSKPYPQGGSINAVADAVSYLFPHHCTQTFSHALAMRNRRDPGWLERRQQRAQTSERTHGQASPLFGRREREQ